MKELFYENQGTNTYLVYEINEDDTLDTMSLGMLTNNSISGLTQTIFTQMNSQKYIKYNVSAKVSVAQFFEGPVNKKRLLGVFSGIVNAMLATEEYMLDETSIILDINYIFTDVSTCETELICLPLVEMDAKKVELGSFFRNIMFCTQFDQTENCDYVAKIINYLNGTPVFTLQDFKRVLEDLQNQKIQPIVTQVNKELSGTVKNTQTNKQPSVQPSSILQEQAIQQRKCSQLSSNQADSRSGADSGEKKQVESQREESEQEISFFYLMQHYNKQNAAIYKAQKAAKKGAAGRNAEKKNNHTTQPSEKSFGFAIPGQETSITPEESRTVAQKETIQNYGEQLSGTKNNGEREKVQEEQIISENIQQRSNVNFGETTVLGKSSIGETTILSAVQNPDARLEPYIIRKKNNEKIVVNKPVFRVGKERSYVDYFIGDNTAISRSHANFIIRDGGYFVVDTNSTNHTFVNGIMIKSNVETAISNGDTIRLANEDFEFRIF